MFITNHICISLCLSVLLRCAIGRILDDGFNNNQDSENNMEYEERSKSDDKDVKKELYNIVWKNNEDHMLDNRMEYYLIPDFIIPDELEFDRKLTALALETSISDKTYLENMNQKISSMEKKLHDIEKNQNYILDNMLERKNVIFLDEKITQIEEDIYRKLNASKDISSCKEQSVYGFNFTTAYRLDSEPFNHIVVKKDEIGVTYFEIHIAIKSARDGIIILSSVPSPDYSDVIFNIGVGIAQNNRTELRLRLDAYDVVKLRTPNILSATQYTAFYIKIANGNLEFGQEGSSPLISYEDARLSSVKYFSFASWGNNEAQFLYDCPETAAKAGEIGAVTSTQMDR